MKILAIIQEKIDALDAQTFKIYALTATSIFSSSCRAYYVSQLSCR